VISAATLLPDAASLPVVDTSLSRISFEDIEIHDEYAIVTWSWVHSGFVTTSLVELEYEAGDPGQGGYWHAHGDCPKAVRDRAAEDASLRQVDSWDDGDDSAWDSRCDYEPDADDRDAPEAF
jgi:hypothetical protein